MFRRYLPAILFFILIATTFMFYWLCIIKKPNHKSENSFKYYKTLKHPKHELMMGNYHCNKYASHPSLFASCTLENVCLTTSGKFLLFLPQNRITLGHRQDFLNSLRTNPWIYTQGRRETDRGNQYIQLVDSDLLVEYSGGLNFTIKSVTGVSIDNLSLTTNGLEEK